MPADIVIGSDAAGRARRDRRAPRPPWTLPEYRQPLAMMRTFGITRAAPADDRMVVRDAVIVFGTLECDPVRDVKLDGIVHQRVQR